VYYNRGRAKFILGQYKGAIADYDMAVYVNPKHHKAYYQRGNTKARLFEDSYDISRKKAETELLQEARAETELLQEAMEESGLLQEAWADRLEAKRLNPQYYKRGSKKPSNQDIEAITDFDKMMVSLI